MEKLSLVALLDEDREMVVANIARDRALSAAQATLEKAIDRVQYRYAEGCVDPVQRDNAQRILQAMKNTLPIMDAVGEAKVWKRHTEAVKRSGPRFTTLSFALLAGGLALVLASVLGVLIAGRGGAFAFVKALVPALGGCACLYFAGALPPDKSSGKAQDEAAERTEYLVDTEKAWHCLRGAMLQADGQLERIREETALERRQSAEQEGKGPVDRATLELCAELLEFAYASKDESAREAASALRFYLHGANVQVSDYESGREAWFEFLPADRPGTIRPALTSEGKLLKKGMASAKH